MAPTELGYLSANYLKDVYFEPSQSKSRSSKSAKSSATHRERSPCRHIVQRTQIKIIFSSISQVCSKAEVLEVGKKRPLLTSHCSYGAVEYV